MTCGYTGVSLSPALDRGTGGSACPALSQMVVIAYAVYSSAIMAHPAA